MTAKNGDKWARTATSAWTCVKMPEPNTFDLKDYDIPCWCLFVVPFLSFAVGLNIGAVLVEVFG